MAAACVAILAINLCAAVGFVPKSAGTGGHDGHEPDSMRMSTTAAAHAGHAASTDAGPAWTASQNGEHETCEVHGCCSLLAKKDSRNGEFEPQILAATAAVELQRARSAATPHGLSDRRAQLSESIPLRL